MISGRAAQLRRVTGVLLDASQPAHALAPEVRELTGILAEHAAFHHDPSADASAGETRTGNGLAISPRQAAMCADDVARTVTFIRGLHAAVLDTRARGIPRPIRVLYAGCGPYATLAVPLMSVWPPEDVTFTLVDLHEQSLDSARAVVTALGLSRSVTRYEPADAARYVIPAHEIPEVVLTETMRACLEHEPQVAIVRHLLQQAPAALLIPQTVRIDAHLINVSKEFEFVDAQHEGPLPPIARDRIFLGTVFELSATTVRSWRPEWTQQIPGSTIRVPDPRPDHHDPFLITTVIVHGEHRISDYDSGLTIPRPLPVAGAIQGGETIECSYRLGPHPALVCAVVDRPRGPAPTQ